MPTGTVTLHRVLRAPPQQQGIPEAISVEMCHLGWQESLQLLAQLVEPDIPGQPVVRRAFADRFDTERLHLRAPRPGDGRALHEAVVESLAQLRAWPASLPWAMQEPSVERSEAWCCDRHLAFAARTDLPLLVFAKDDGALVGATGLHRFDWDSGRFEVGWWLRTGASGRGLMTEAVRGVIDFGLTQLGAKRLECLADEANHRSRRVAERAGFTLESIRRDERRDPDGTPRSMCVYALQA